MSRFHLDFEVVDRLATEPEEWRRWVRGEEMECREMKGVRPELLVLTAARIGPGSEKRTRFVRRGVAGGVSRPWTQASAHELVALVVFSACLLRLKFEQERRTRRKAIGKLSSPAWLD